MTHNINLNDKCKVVLTDSGLREYNKKMRELGSDERLRNHVFIGQLHEIMLYWGDMCYNGAVNIPFVDNKIELI